jgi:hypothetical protein
MRWLTLIEVYAEMSQSWKRVHLHKVLIFIFQFLSQNFQLLSSELPMTPLGRFPVVGCHFEGSVRILRWSEDISGGGQSSISGLRKADYCLQLLQIT